VRCQRCTFPWESAGQLQMRNQFHVTAARISSVHYVMPIRAAAGLYEYSGDEFGYCCRYQRLVTRKHTARGGAHLDAPGFAYLLATRHISHRREKQQLCDGLQAATLAYRVCRHAQSMHRHSQTVVVSSSSRSVTWVAWPGKVQIIRRT
jgi:hypothetical protein